MDGKNETDWKFMLLLVEMEEFYKDKNPSRQDQQRRFIWATRFLELGKTLGREDGNNGG